MLLLIFTKIYINYDKRRHIPLFYDRVVELIGLVGEVERKAKYNEEKNSNEFNDYGCSFYITGGLY